MNSLVKFQDADILNGESTVIYGFDMEINEGDFVYIIGKVGSGKTSIIRTMIAENPLKKGKAVVCGYQLETIRKRNVPYLRRSIGIVFQDFQLLTDRSVEDNLKFVLKNTGWKNKAEIDERIEKVLKDVGMETKAHKMPHQLSGGEQQRVAIARALAKKPKLLLCDEPTGALDYRTGKAILKLLQDTCRKTGMTVVIITHNKALCAMADRVVRIKSGTVQDVHINETVTPVENIEW